MRCLIFTAVWGRWHTDQFINLNLPSLLAENNLPAFARDIEAEFVVATSRSDSRAIRNSPAFRLLSEIVRVRINTYRDSEFGAPIQTHKKIWIDGMRSAVRTGSFYLLNVPDVIWADGSFKTLARRIGTGKKVIYSMIARVLDKTFTREALAFRNQGGAITIPPRAMVDMMLRHLHPLSAVYLRDSDQFPSHSELVFWPIHGEGLVMRLLAALMLGFDPVEYKVNSEFLLKTVRRPQDLTFINDSDELCCVSLTPLRKDQNWYSTFRPLDIDEVGSWWLAFDDPANLALARTRFYFHTSGTRSAAWQRAKHSSDFFVLQSITSREIIRVGRQLKRNGCNIAAEILATALYAARLRRRWRWLPPVSIVVPNDYALAPHQHEIAVRFLAPGREKELIGLVFAHVARGRISADRATTLNGRVLIVDRGPGGLMIGGRQVVASIELPQENQLLIVDGILPSSDLGSAGGGERSRPLQVSRGSH